MLSAFAPKNQVMGRSWSSPQAATSELTGSRRGEQLTSLVISNGSSGSERYGGSGESILYCGRREAEE